MRTPTASPNHQRTQASRKESCRSPASVSTVTPFVAAIAVLKPAAPAVSATTVRTRSSCGAEADTPHDRGADDRLERVSDRDPRRDGYRGIARHVRDERAGGNRGPVPRPRMKGGERDSRRRPDGVITPWATSRLIPSLAAPTYEPLTRTKSPAAIRRPAALGEV